MLNEWNKFKSMGGGFQNIVVLDGVVDGVEENHFLVDIGTYSGGGSPRWLKKTPEFKTDASKRRAKGLEKVKIEKKLGKLRAKIDLIVHNEMRRLGYTLGN